MFIRILVYLDLLKLFYALLFVELKSHHILNSIYQSMFLALIDKLPSVYLLIHTKSIQSEVDNKAPLFDINATGNMREENFT